MYINNKYIYNINVYYEKITNYSNNRTYILIIFYNLSSKIEIKNKYQK